MFVNENYKRTKYICFQWDQGYQTLLIIFWVLSSYADCLLVTMKVLASPPVIFGSRYRSLPIISSQKRSDVEEYFYVLCWWHHRIIESHGCGWTDGCCINPGILNRIFNQRIKDFVIFYLRHLWLEHGEKDQQSVAEAHGHRLGKPVHILHTLLLQDLEEDDIEDAACCYALEYEEGRTTGLLKLSCKYLSRNDTKVSSTDSSLSTSPTPMPMGEITQKTVMYRRATRGFSCNQALYRIL